MHEHIDSFPKPVSHYSSNPLTYFDGELTVIMLDTRIPMLHQHLGWKTKTVTFPVTKAYNGKVPIKRRRYKISKRFPNTSQKNISSFVTLGLHGLHQKTRTLKLSKPKDTHVSNLKVCNIM